MGGFPQKFTDEQLIALVVGEGKTQNQAAEELGVTKGAVSRRLKAIKKRTTVAVVSKEAIQVVDEQLDVMKQLRRINAEAYHLLDKLADNPGLKIRLLGEIRSQLSFQMQIFETLFDAKSAQAFQEAVLDTLAQVDPKIRDMCIEKLNKQQILRQSVTWAKRAV